MQPPIDPHWSLLLVILWLAPASAYLMPALADAAAAAWRRPGSHATLFVLAALWIALKAFPSSADKGGGETNPPPADAAAPQGRIMLYYEDPFNGRLVPLGAELRGGQ